MKIEDYKLDPCNLSSLPYHKRAYLENVTVVHEKDYKGEKLSEPYFRCINNLNDLVAIKIPKGYVLETLDILDTQVQKDLSDFVMKCYPLERLPVSQIKSMIDSNYFDSNLWLKLSTIEGEIVATGISEIDRKVKEGTLEWIQVLPAYRKQGLGKIIVRETLNYFKGKVDFVTVSGKVEKVSQPILLYESCGFKNKVIWHFIR